MPVTKLTENFWNDLYEERGFCWIRLEGFILAFIYILALFYS